MEPDVVDFLEENRKLVFDWYKQADTKAQINLGFIGVILSILVGSLLSMASRSDKSVLAAYLDKNPAVVNVAVVSFLLAFLALTIMCYFASIVLSACALWSRGMFRQAGKGVRFFGEIANYEKAADFHEDVVNSIGDTQVNVNQLEEDILVLSRNTKLKHRLVNLAALFSGAALVLTVLLALILGLAAISM